MRALLLLLLGACERDPASELVAAQLRYGSMEQERFARRSVENFATITMSRAVGSRGPYLPVTLRDVVSQPDGRVICGHMTAQGGYATPFVITLGQPFPDYGTVAAQFLPDLQRQTGPQWIEHAEKMRSIIAAKCGEGVS